MKLKSKVRRESLAPNDLLHPARGRAGTRRLLRSSRRQAPSLSSAAPAEEMSPEPAGLSPEPVAHQAEALETARVTGGYVPGAGEISALQLYLREIGQVQLLTPKEEITLARRIQKGDDQAREQMIKANLRLVVKIAREYEHLGLPLLDLINEGNMGLMKGVERFDPTKGAKLSTYASWWIKQSIKRALANQSKTIRLPVHVIDKMAHIRRAELKLKEVLDRDPTDEELAEDVGVKAQRIREYRVAAKAPVSLDAPLSEDDESARVSEMVADPRAQAPFEHLAKDSDLGLLKEVFVALSPREQAILGLRFGLTDDTPRTLEEIGQQYGLTRERIRQIENEGLKKLRARMTRRDKLAAEAIEALNE